MASIELPRSEINQRGEGESMQPRQESPAAPAKAPEIASEELDSLEGEEKAFAELVDKYQTGVRAIQGIESQVGTDFAKKMRADFTVEIGYRDAYQQFRDKFGVRGVEISNAVTRKHNILEDKVQAEDIIRRFQDQNVSIRRSSGVVEPGWKVVNVTKNGEVRVGRVTGEGQEQKKDIPVKEFLVLNSINQ